MKVDLYKICADSLRTFSKEKYDLKLKATHAHELVAAYFGYSSKNAMLADTKYPASNLSQAEIIVSMPEEFIDQRRNNLHELPTELPDSYTLGEAVYTPLFSDELWSSEYPPFSSFKTLAKYLVENSAAFHAAFPFYRDIQYQHVVDVKEKEDGVLLTVFHCYENTAGELLGQGKTTIRLQRVAGHIGYCSPQLMPELWSGEFAGRKVKELLANI